MPESGGAPRGAGGSACGALTWPGSAAQVARLPTVSMPASGQRMRSHSTMSWHSTPLPAVVLDARCRDLPALLAGLDLADQDVEVAGKGAGVEHNELVERA